MAVYRKVLIADTQLHSWQRFGASEENPKLTKLTMAQMKALAQFVGIVDITSADSVEHAGDVFQQRGTLPVIAVNMADKIFNKELRYKRNIITHLTGGNHDQLDDENYEEHGDALNFIRHALEEEDNFKVFRINYWDQIDYDAIKGYDLVVVHKEPTGAKDGKYECKIGVDWKTLAANNTLVVFGHIHTRQQLGDNCFVLGDFIQLTFEETEDKGVWLLEKQDDSIPGEDDDAFYNNPELKATEEYFFDNNHMKLSFFPLDFPKFRTVETNEQLPTKEERKENFYRITDADVKVEDQSVISVVKSINYEEAIKSNDLKDILAEWAEGNDKPAEYMEKIKTYISDVSRYATPVFDGRLNSVGLTNFMSHEDSYVEFENGLISMYGTNGTFGDSNGCGKSTICEGILWCLFNDLSKDKSRKEEVVRDTPELQKEASVEVELIKSDGTSVRVQRSTSSGLSIFMDVKQDDGTVKEIDVVGHMKAKARQEYLENQVLGFNKSLFLTSCYFSQENLQMITGMAKTDKTNMIMSLLGFDQYDELYSKVSDKIKEIDLAFSKFVSEESLIENSMLHHDSNKENINQSLLEVNETLNQESALINVQLKLKEINEKMEKQSQFDIAMPEAPVLLEEEPRNYVPTKDFCLEIEGLSSTLSNIDLRLSQIKEDIKAVEFEHSKALALVSQKKVERDGYERDIQKHESSIKRLLEQRVGGFCPTCGGEVTKDSAQRCIEATEEIIAELSTKLEALDQEIGILTKEADDILSTSKKDLDLRIAKGTERKLGVEVALEELKQAKENDLQEYNKIYLESVESIRVQNRKLQEQYTLSIQAYNQAKADQDKINQEGRVKQAELVREESQLKVGIDIANKDKIKYESELVSLEKTIGDLNSKKTVILNSKETYKNDLLIYEFWKQAFSTKGIRASLISKFCNSFNSVVSEYAADIGGGAFSVYIEPQRELADGDTRNELDIKVRIGDTVRRYAMYSGGEKRRIDISLCLALNKWVSQKHGLSNGILGMLMLDELFSFIDNAGEETTALVLQKESKDRCVLVVSHTPELKSYAKQTWNVYKDDNRISRINIKG